MKTRTKRSRKVLFLLISGLVGILLSVGLAAPGQTAVAQGQEPPSPYVTIQDTTMSNGAPVSATIINGPSKPPAGWEAYRASADAYAATAHMLNVPAYSWVFGCSSVSAAMIAGYYDNNGYSSMYTGPTNGGLMPLVEDASWGSWSDGADTYPNNPLIASHNGLDGRSTRGSIDDYWVQYNSAANDPYITNGWTQHAWGSAIGDYMKTSQSAYGNPDGATSFYGYPSLPDKLTCSDMALGGIADEDGTYGRKLFYEAKGYTVTDCYSQTTDNKVAGGFSFANYKAEIDAGHPVLINLYGHSVVGVGYDDVGNTVYLHDTWDSSNHTMTWGGSYPSSGTNPPPMEMLAVSVVNLAPTGPTAPTPQAPSGAISDNTPTYTWSVVPEATQYQYQVEQNGSPISTAPVDPSACDASTCSDTPASVLPDGAYQWRVQANVGGSWTSYSSYMTFNVITVPVPQAPSGVITSGTPTFRWTPVPGATQYQYEVEQNGSTLSTVPVDASACNATACTNTPTTALLPGDYQWRVQADVNGGLSAFSQYLSFSITAIPTPTAPAGVTSDTTPTYKWTTVPGATQYRYKLLKGTALVYTSKPISATTCGAATCANTPTKVLLYAATYKWAVQANIGGAWTSYSPFKAFSITNVPAPQTPFGAITDTTPTYKWTRISGATQYQYSVFRSGVLQYSKTVANSTCGANALYCVNTPTTVLPLGSYTWNVKSYVGGKWSAASAAKAFSLKPKAGYWESAYDWEDFYVNPTRTQVLQFTTYFQCPPGSWWYVEHVPVSIVNNRFTMAGAFYGSGTFTAPGIAKGQDGLKNLYVGSPCNAYVSGGPWSFTANWKNTNQPTAQIQRAIANFLQQLGMPNLRLPDPYRIVRTVAP